MTTCSKRYTDIPFAHRQHSHDGHCQLIHGHNWSFDFTFEATTLDANGFVVDFGSLGWLKAWLNDTFDHALVLNASDPHLASLRSKLDGLARIVVVDSASSEGLARMLFALVDRRVREETDGRVGLRAVVVEEDGKNRAGYDVFQRLADVETPGEERP